jgi:hypothetical protein
MIKRTSLLVITLLALSGCDQIAQKIIPQLPPPEGPGAAKKKKPAAPVEAKEETKPADEKPAAKEESKSAAKH